MFTLPEILFLMSSSRNGLLWEAEGIKEFGLIAQQNENILHGLPDNNAGELIDKLVARLTEAAKNYGRV